MTLYRGLLLFDIAEEPINGWCEHLGYRGMLDRWSRGSENIWIDVDEDKTDEDDAWFVLWEDEKSGAAEYLDFGSYQKCKDSAVEYMKTH